MAITITGGKYAVASLSSAGTGTVTVSTTPFVQADFNTQRIVGLWDSAGTTFKGMAYIRNWMNTSQIQLSGLFFDPATGETVTQVVGDTVLISKNFAESVTTGLTVSGISVSITDGTSVTFGTAGTSRSVCFYDAAKQIATNASTLFAGGLAVFGKLEDYLLNTVSSPCSWYLTGTSADSSRGIRVTNASANALFYGGQIDGNRANTYYIGGNAANTGGGVGGNTLVLNSVQNCFDFASPNAGGSWGANASRHKLVNCFSQSTAVNAILARWGDGIISGGSYNFPNNTTNTISAFGSDVAGTYSIGAPAGSRSVVNMNGKASGETGIPSLWRAGANTNQTVNFTNILSYDRRATFSAGSNQSNATQNFYFSDSYTNLVSGTVAVILRNGSTTPVASSASVSGMWNPSVLQEIWNGVSRTTTYGPWTYGFKSYGYAPVGGSFATSTYQLELPLTADNVVLGGAINQVALSPTVTLSKAAALALTSIATLDNLFDAAMAWSTNSVANAKYPTLGTYMVSPNGDVLDFGSINIVVDGAAASAFAVNTGTNTVTIKATTLAAGTKFAKFTTTGTVTTQNGATISSPYTSVAGTRVTIKSNAGLLLSTALLVDGTPQAFQAQQAERYIFVTPTSVVRIYAHAYGYQPKIINITGNNISDYIIALNPEVYVDTTQDTTTRDYLVSHTAIGTDAFSRIFLSVDIDMRSYTPAQVLNALHRYIVVSGSIVASACIAGNSVDGFAIIEGGAIIRSPAFYGKVNDSVTSVSNLGIFAPITFQVDPSVYVAMPTYTPVEKNTSSVVLQYAPWTQTEATLSSAEKNEIRAGLALDATVTARPTLAQIEESAVLAKESTVGSRASQASVDAVKTNTNLIPALL